MSTARFSTKGQIVVPKKHRDAYAFDVGSEVEFVPEADGLKIRLRSKNGMARTTASEVSGILAPFYKGPALSAEDIALSLQSALRREWRDEAKDA